MSLKVESINPFEDERWDKFVQKHPSGWICHLSQWKTILENSFPHMQGYYVAIIDEEDSTIIAGLSLFAVDSWLTGRRLVSIPFATLSDPLITDSNEIDMLLKYANEGLKGKNASYLQLITFQYTSISNYVHLEKSTDYINHFLALDQNPEGLLKTSFHSSVRKGIKKALKAKFDIVLGSNDVHVKQFYKVYIETRARFGLPPQPLRFFLNLFNILSRQGLITLILAKHNGKIIGGLILLRYKNRVSADYLASDIAYRQLRIDSFLYWEAVKFSWQNGCRIFDFGRTSILNEGLLRFKDRWGTTRKNISHYHYFYKGHKISKETSFLYKSIRTICMRAPKPILPFIGNLLYRHMG